MRCSNNADQFYTEDATLRTVEDTKNVLIQYTARFPFCDFFLLVEFKHKKRFSKVKLSTIH